MRRFIHGLAGMLTVSLVTSLVSAAEPAGTYDWPYWRGPEMNGISRETNLPESWSPEGENLLWKSEEYGTRSTPIVMRGKLYFLCRHNPHTKQEAEKVVCADAATGKKIWENIFNVYTTDVPDTRVAWSSVVGDPATGNIFALGVCGHFQCLDGATGKTIWSRALSEEFGMLSTYGGRTNFPVVYDNVVIIGGVIIGWGDMAKPAHRILAFDKRNGEAIWFQSTTLFPEDTTYSAPVLAVIDGQAQVILGAGDGGVWGFQPRTGKLLWKYKVSPRGINTTPVVAGNSIFCGHSEENIGDTRMGALFAIDGAKSGDLTKSGERWRMLEQSVGKAAPLVVEDRVYSIDDAGAFYVNDVQSGQLVGKAKIGTMGRGSPVYGDGKIYCTDCNGRWFIYKLDPAKGVKKIHNLMLEPEINASPIISHGRIYLATEKVMYCIGKADAKPTGEPVPNLLVEAPREADDKPATALLTPVEALLKPGQSQRYQVWLYNARGQYLRTASAKDVKFTASGAGAIAEDGKFTAASEAVHQAAFLTAEVEGLKATARARVVPEFPWQFGFDDGIVPITGVGMRYRHIGIDHDLFQEFKRQDPLLSRLYIYLSTQFTNQEKPAVKFDDTTPAQNWTGFKRYLGIIEAVTNQEQAQAKIDPLLKTLQDAQVIEKWNWSGTEEIGVQLNVTKGPRKVTGNGVMCKITTIPKGTRSQGWLGHPTSKNYVVQADVMANSVEVSETADRNAKLPDFGLMNQRYRLELMGASQQLKLYSWYPHDQKYHEVPFAWGPDVWYTVKVEVTTADQQGEPVSTIRGKVWKREDPEPAEWSIEWTDSPGNLQGSPGMFGNSKDAELFIDNVRVTPRN